jgi:mono/diheme cytochrome c family protein
MKLSLPVALFVASGITLLSAACGDHPPPTEDSSDTSSGVEKEPAQPSSDMAGHPGKEVYDENCLPCHQADGYGVPAMHPPVVDNEWVLGDKERLIKIVLLGMTGEIEVDGEIYDGVMASADYLTDKEIADVLTYLRKSFGNNASEVSEEEVREVRSSLREADSVKDEP